MLTPEDLERLRAGLAEAGAPLALILHPADADHPLAARLTEAAREVAAAVPAVAVRDGADDAAGAAGVGGAEAGADAAGTRPPARPALTLAGGDRRNLHYLAAPAGPEAAPFVEALLALGRPQEVDLDRETRGALGARTRPAQLLVFIAPQCPHCPQAVRAATQVAAAAPQVTVSIVDAEAFPDLAARYTVRSVPCTVLDDGWTHVGVLPAAALAAQLLAPDDLEQEEAVFRSLIAAGRHDEAGVRLRTPAGGAAFVDAWITSSTGDRMSLLLAVEEALEADPRGLDALVPDLLPVLRTADAALRGDTADLLGQIGHPDAAPALQPLRQDENPDVAEIAGEALAAIEENEG